MRKMVLLLRMFDLVCCYVAVTCCELWVEQNEGFVMPQFETEECIYRVCE